MEQDYAVRLALDWADRKHAWAMQVTGENRTEQGQLEHTPEAVEVFVVTLAARFPGRKIAVALEQSKGALFYMLAKYHALDLYPVHPATLHHYRQSLYPSGAKSDPQDAALILEFLCRHAERLRPVVADSDDARLLAQLVEDRRAMVDEQTRTSNQLTALLKLYFPQVLQWFDADQPVLADLLRRWPTLEQLRHTRPATLAEFLRSHSVPQPKRERVCQQLAHAVAALSDAAVLESAQGKVRHLLRQFSLLRERIGELEKRIGELTAAHPDRGIFASLPGAGPAMLPRLLAAFGTERGRFQSAQQLQCYSGIAPVQEASGRTKIVKWRWSCPTFLRQTFHEWAWLSTRRSVWARTYYDTQRARGKSHHAAVRALAYKWIRILFRCWQARTPYVESVYLAALQKRGNPVGVLWIKNPGGSTFPLTP